MNSAEKQKELQMVDLVKTFYSNYQTAVDYRRPTIAQFYAEDGHIVFDGNMYKSPTFIRSFWTQLPQTEHTYRSLNHTSFVIPTTQRHIVVIAASGNVTYNDKPYCYTQSLTCTIQNGELKILTDNYRLLK
uniref:NTF2 domain-containing protein n=1 Tax=Panagrolaimus sp. JU765 TaxID=591449 RepID=A0AC34RJX6_9BILA